MNKVRYVLDTVALISYFSAIFRTDSKISKRQANVIDKAFHNEDAGILFIPSIVFVEIFDKWFAGATAAAEEFRAKLRSEVLYPIQSAPNIEIRELDFETIEIFLGLTAPNMVLEHHDRIIVATAVSLQAKLITSDGPIERFARSYPEVVLFQ